MRRFIFLIACMALWTRCTAERDQCLLAYQMRVLLRSYLLPFSSRSFSTLVKLPNTLVNLHGYAILPNPGMLRGIVPDRIELSSKVSLPISGQTFTGLSYQNWRVRAKKTRVCAKFVLEKEILINFIAQIVLHPTEVWSLSTICNDVHGVTET